MVAFVFIPGRLLYLSFRLKAPTLRDASLPRSLMVVLHVMLPVFPAYQRKVEFMHNDIYLHYPWILFGLIVANARITRNRGSAVTAVGPVPSGTPGSSGGAS